MMAAEELTTPTIAEWAEIVLGDQGPWSVLCIDPQRSAPYTQWAIDATQLALIAATAEGDRWVGVGTRRERLTKGRGGDIDVRHIHALWADIDIAGDGHKTAHTLPADEGEAWALLNRCPLPPTNVLHSGGGLQAYWALAEPCEPPNAVRLLEAWGQWWSDQTAATGLHVDAVFDLARVMRLPGTHNHKTDTPRPVRHLTWEPTRRYGLDDLEWLPEPSAARPVPHLAPVAGYVGPDRPGDHFAAQHTCAEILERNGWTLHHRDRAGDEHWTRPGKERRQGSSATVFAADGRCVVWTDGVPGVNPRDSLNPFRLFAKLEHGGDFTRATKELSARGYGSAQVRPIELRIGQAPKEETPEVEESTTDRSIQTLLREALYTDATLENIPRTPPLIRGVIGLDSLSMFYGPSGNGKSFVMLDQALHIATGKRWMGRRTRKGPVLYIIGEGLGGISRRIQAWKAHHGIDKPIDGFYLLGMMPRFMDAGHINALLEVIEEMPRPPLAIYVDTLARAIVGGDENTATDAGVLIDNANALSRATGAHVAIVHHTGYNTTHARGSTAFLGGLDTQFEVIKDGRTITVRSTKQKESESGEGETFELVDVHGLPKPPPEDWGDNEDEDEEDDAIPVVAVWQKSKEAPTDANGVDKRDGYEEWNGKMLADISRFVEEARISVTVDGIRKFFGLSGSKTDAAVAWLLERGYIAREAGMNQRGKPAAFYSHVKEYRWDSGIVTVSDLTPAHTRSHPLTPADHRVSDDNGQSHTRESHTRPPFRGVAGVRVSDQSAGVGVTEEEVKEQSDTRSAMPVEAQTEPTTPPLSVVDVEAWFRP